MAGLVRMHSVEVLGSRLGRGQVVEELMIDRGLFRPISGTACCVGSMLVIPMVG